MRCLTHMQPQDWAGMTYRMYILLRHTCLLSHVHMHPHTHFRFGGDHILSSLHLSTYDKATRTEINRCGKDLASVRKHPESYDVVITAIASIRLRPKDALGSYLVWDCSWWGPCFLCQYSWCNIHNPSQSLIKRDDGLWTVIIFNIKPSSVDTLYNSQ